MVRTYSCCMYCNIMYCLQTPTTTRHKLRDFTSLCTRESRVYRVMTRATSRHLVPVERPRRRYVRRCVPALFCALLLLPSPALSLARHSGHEAIWRDRHHLQHQGASQRDGRRPAQSPPPWHEPTTTSRRRPAQSPPGLGPRAQRSGEG